MTLRGRIWFVIKLALAFGTPVVLFGLTLYYEYRGLSAHGSISDAYAVGLISIALSLAPLGLMILGLIALIYVRRKSVGVLLLGACFTFTGAALLSTHWREGLRLDAFEAFSARTAPLIQAIEGYSQARGRIPQNLDRLTPEYLSRVPGTGMAAFPELIYHTEVITPEAQTWGLEVTISTSPPARLLYRPAQNYSDLEGAMEQVGDWIFEYQEFNRGP